MDKLPENPQTRDEELGIQQRLDKAWLAPLSSSAASSPTPEQVKTQFLHLTREQVHSRTFALVLVLHAHLMNRSLAMGDLQYVARFFEWCDGDQLGKLAGEVELIARQFVSSFKSPRLAAQAVGPLMLCAEKLVRGQLFVLTSVHVDVLQASLLGKMYSAADLFLERVLFAPQALRLDLPLKRKMSTQTLALDLHRFFYYAGVVYCGVEKYAHAQEQFAQCLALPTKATSAVQFEAYKKYVLVSLIAQGQVPALPSYCSAVVHKSFGQAVGGQDGPSNAYSALQHAFNKPEAGAQVLERIGASYRDEFVGSGNAGLVEQVQLAHVKHRVIKLTDTYVTLGFAELQAQLGLREAMEPYLARMIAKGEISAVLDQEMQVVRFLDQPVPHQVAKLETELGKMQSLAKDLRDFDTRLSTSASFVRGMTLGRNTASASKRGGSAMDE